MRHRLFDSTGGHDTTRVVVYGHKSVAARLSYRAATFEPSYSNLME